VEACLQRHRYTQESSIRIVRSWNCKFRFCQSFSDTPVTKMFKLFFHFCTDKREAGDTDLINLRYSLWTMVCLVVVSVARLLANFNRDSAVICRTLIV
jgi:hypothetical protein